MTFEKEEPEVGEIVEKAKAFESQEKRALKDKGDDVISIHTDKVQMERAREVGPVHAGCQFWKKLKMDEILKQAGFSEKTRLLALLMVMTLEAAFIEIHAKGKRIPNWMLVDKTVTVLPSSPVKSDEPVENITLIPMGCARLRISCFPTIGVGSDLHE